MKPTIMISERIKNLTNFRNHPIAFMYELKIPVYVRTKKVKRNKNFDFFIFFYTLVHQNCWLSFFASFSSSLTTRYFDIKQLEKQKKTRKEGAS